MKRASVVMLLVSALLVASPALAAVTGYYRFPTIHGDQIVFAAENDLWQVSTDGGLAQRLTTHAGNEAFPKFSPDGNWLAFSAEYDGNVDVYVMPAGGGEPQRLTYHPDHDEVIAWRPDSSAVVFRSRRISTTRDQNVFEVPVTGGQPTLVPIGFASLVAFSADGQFVAFNRFSREFRNWKRYLGGRAQDIWVGDLKAKRFWKLTDWEGTDRFPMWHGDSVCFLSDRDGRLNVYSAKPDGTDVRQLTRHEEYDARWPSIDGERIVYMHGGDLWLLDIASGETKQLDIQLPTDRVRSRHQFVNAADTLDGFALDDAGERIVLSSRGEIWVRPTKPGRTIQITRSGGIRERGVSFSPDGLHLAAITDETGEQELIILDALGRDKPRILTGRGKGWIFPPVWSPDGKKLAYADLTFALFVVDVESGAVTEVDKSEFWEIREYAFAPDGKWLAYAKQVAAGESSIFVYNLDTGRSHAVTTEFTNDHDPVWDPQGRYLYFLSDHTYNPLVGERDFDHIVTETGKPYLVILAADGLSPFLPKELLPDDDDDKDDKKKDGEKDKRDDDKPPSAEERLLTDMRVDVEGIQQRVVEFPVAPGNYGDLRAIKGKIFYMSYPSRGLVEGRVYGEKWERTPSLHVFDIKDKEDEVFIEELADYCLSGDGERIAYLVDDEITVGDTDESPDDADEDDLDNIDPGDLPLAIRPAEEWTQIFHEAWRLQRDFYWAENMAGIDWPAERERYAKLLARVSTRFELSDLLGQMVGELGTSHTYIWGGDLRRGRRVTVGLLGADLEPLPDSGVHRFARVLRPEVWETDIPAPLTMSHANVHTGDYLFAINGVDLAPGDNIYQHLAKLAGEEVLLTVGTKADRGDARDIQVKTLTSERRLRYRDWVRRNREYVAEKTDGKVGYLHLPDMGGNGLVEFIKAFYPQIERDGLIIDVRSNGGGFVSQMIIERLARKAWAFDQTRRGKLSTYPWRVHRGHKAVITDENAGSDGDILPESFQILGLGPVIGMRSWGGVVGIRADKPFIDGGGNSQPEFAWWEPRRGWGLENRGVEPDIEVPFLPEDCIAGRDPQLDRAISELLKMIEENPVEYPQLDPIPDKSREKMRTP